MKRTKRYGGFLVGDKVKAKGYDKLNGEVVGFLNGYLKCVFNEIAPRVEVVFAPNQLINLTRFEEENRRITDQLPLREEETAEELIERLQRMHMENWKPEDHDIMPSEFKLDVKPLLPPL